MVITFLPKSKHLLFSWAPKSLQMMTAAMKLKDACSLEEKLWPPRQRIKRQRHYFVHKDLSSQSYGFSNSQVWMWQLDYKESWALRNWCSWTGCYDWNYLKFYSFFCHFWELYFCQICVFHHNYHNYCHKDVYCFPYSFSA